MSIKRCKWLRFTEESNALDYLEKAYFFIKQTEKEKIAWKWVTITLFGALYGFAICACRGTDSSIVIENTKKRDKLISFNEALKRCKDPNWMKMTTMSKHLELSEKQEESIRKMKDVLRNRFEHYTPMGWSIEIHGLPKIALDVLDVIRFLALDTGNYVHLNSNQVRKLKSYIFQSKKILKQSKLYKETINKTTTIKN